MVHSAGHAGKYMTLHVFARESCHVDYERYHVTLVISQATDSQENCEEEMKDLGAKNAVLAEACDELQLESIQRNAEIELKKMEKNALEAQANERLREQELDMNGLEDQLRERDWTIVRMVDCANVFRMGCRG